jgi:hypothetical protein
VDVEAHCSSSTEEAVIERSFEAEQGLGNYQLYASGNYAV